MKNTFESSKSTERVLCALHNPSYAVFPRIGRFFRAVLRTRGMSHNTMAVVGAIALVAALCILSDAMRSRRDAELSLAHARYIRTFIGGGR